MKYGFSPDHWKHIIDVEILKKAKVYDINKMRTITLMDAEFNMNNKFVGREATKCTEKASAIAPEQCRTRANQKAARVPLCKCLTMDLVCQRKTAVALCSNDAKSCFDRIALNIASLSFQ